MVWTIWTLPMKSRWARSSSRLLILKQDRIFFWQLDRDYRKGFYPRRWLSSKYCSHIYFRHLWYIWCVVLHLPHRGYHIRNHFHSKNKSSRTTWHRCIFARHSKYLFKNPSGRHHDKTTELPHYCKCYHLHLLNEFLADQLILSNEASSISPSIVGGTLSSVNQFVWKITYFDKLLSLSFLQFLSTKIKNERIMQLNSH